MSQSVDEKTTQLADLARLVTLTFGPLMLGNQLGRSAYFSTCQGLAFYAGASSPANLISLVVILAAGYLAWLISDPLIRSGFVALLASQLLRWGWALTGVSPGPPTIWAAHLISASLLTVAAVRSARVRGYVLALTLFVVAFVLTWWAIGNAMTAFGRHSVLHYGPGC